ncbi:GNAT family N-acetyltransferase [Crocosphaera sp.]|uniref:GNAT family N-acetyltransferase n=1 Tax=Crocosphaera sp. TaxID=2729996 RepID=UPI003F25293E|nr:GNAT family N-acetyltransferase [Crocosphaera sp.]
MKPYVEKLYPWNPQLFRNNFIADDYQVITLDNKVIGFVKVVDSDTEIYLAEIQIANNHQRMGIATHVIHSLIENAQTHHQKLWLKVLKTNPAQSLYQRLGFTLTSQSSTHYIMEWSSSQ